MLRYFFRRLLQIIPVLLVMSAGIFVATTHLPGDPAVSIVGMEASEAERAAARERYGLDRPIVVQYVSWLGRAVQGDFGRSLRTREPVGNMLRDRAPVTLQLTFMAMLLAASVGIPLGVIAARNRGKLIDSIVSAVALTAVAIPFFWLGVLLILLFAIALKLLPPSGYVSFLDDPLRNLQLMIMPTITVGLAMSALVMRQTRSAMLQVLGQDFVKTARAKGATQGRVTYRHALPNALIPVITVIGLQTGALLGGAIVTERVFSLPGVGTMIVEGIFNRDFPVIQGAMVFIVAAVLIINLITDLSYAAVDPRIKY